MRRPAVLRDPFLKSLRDQVRGLIVWAIGVAAYVALLMSVYPSIRDSSGQLQGYLDNLPDAFRKAFLGPGGDFTSPAGYINTELFSWLMPIAFIAFAIAAANRALAGEEEDGTLSLVLAYPLSRRSLVLQKFAAMLVAVALLGLTCWVALVVATSAMTMDVGAWALAQALVLFTLLGLAVGSVTLAVGAATGRKAAGVAAGAGAGVAMYLLNTLGQINDRLEAFRVLSLFKYTGGTTPLGKDISAVDLAVLAGATLALLAVALVLFESRDIRV
jgi:ABC-2 type transport system permease protein